MTEQAHTYIVSGDIKVSIRSIWTPVTIRVEVAGVQNVQEAMDAALAAQLSAARQEDEDALAVWPSEPMVERVPTLTWEA